VIFIFKFHSGFPLSTEGKHSCVQRGVQAQREYVYDSCNKPSIERAQSTRWLFAFALCCHSNETRASMANPPNSAQLGGTPTIPSYITVRAAVWECGEGQTHRRAWPLYISRRLRTIFFYL